MFRHGCGLLVKSEFRSRSSLDDGLQLLSILAIKIPVPIGPYKPYDRLYIKIDSNPANQWSYACALGCVSAIWECRVPSQKMRNSLHRKTNAPYVGGVCAHNQRRIWFLTPDEMHFTVVSLSPGVTVTSVKVTAFRSAMVCKGRETALCSKQEPARLTIWSPVCIAL